MGLQTARPSLSRHSRIVDGALLPPRGWAHSYLPPLPYNGVWTAYAYLFFIRRHGGLGLIKAPDAVRRGSNIASFQRTVRSTQQVRALHQQRPNYQYDPKDAADQESTELTCSSLCPASPTKIYHGNSINRAVAPDGKRYSELATALVYREKIIPGCTCNGRDAFGLVTPPVADDPTLRPGDIVATNTPSGLRV